MPMPKAPQVSAVTAIILLHILSTSGACMRWPRHEPSTPENGQCLGTPDQLIGLGPNHVPCAVQLPVEQESTNVACTPQERDERITRETLGHVPPPMHEIAPHRSDRPVVRPDEECPAPAPATTQVLARGPPHRRSPEDEEAGRASERLQRRQWSRTGRHPTVSREHFGAP